MRDRDDVPEPEPVPGLDRQRRVRQFDWRVRPPQLSARVLVANARMRTRLALALIVSSACVDHPDDASAKSRDASIEDASTPDAEQRSAVDPSCVPPPDCLPIVNLINVGVCCSDTLRCGWDVTDFAKAAAMEPQLDTLGFDLATACWPRGDLYYEVPAPPEKRVAAASGDILLAADCTSRSFAGSLLAGCCLPDDTCGFSTQGALSAFKALLMQGDEPEPFTSAECVTPKELNAQLADSKLVAWAHVPASKGKCDYAALDAKLPPLTAP
jgi:hypothetical protein